MPQIILEAQNPVPLFTLNDQEGGSVALSDYLGKKVIIYFYPAAGTPGCTTQACDFSGQYGFLSGRRLCRTGDI